MKNISTLVEDINNVMGAVEREGLDLSRFAANIQNAYSKQAGVREEKVRTPNTLYFSEIGDPCMRRIWYKVNDTSKAEELPPATRIKFLYGDILEELVLQLARDAGHSVSDEQVSVEFPIGETGWKVRGRIDAIIDGAVVDVKSVTKMSEVKFQNGLVDDPFGYKLQLSGYATVLKNSEAGFLTIQKELGHVNYYPTPVDSHYFVTQAEHVVDAVQESSVATLDRQPPVAQSATSKNKKLCTTCSYCAYKKECWPELRVFAYSNGPVFLVDVVDVPKVPELCL